MASPEEQLEALCRGAEHVVSKEELLQRLESGRPLRIKYGADPSAPDLHLGHSVPMRKLRLFQEFGHEVTFIVGDFTGRIGDPSGKTKTRPMLSEEEVQRNAATYAEQASKILDMSQAKLVYNSSFFEHLGAGGFLELASTYTVAAMLKRDDFAQRLAQEEPISIRELLYPLVQAWDSVSMKADVEIGGSDQLFNFLVARDVMRAYGLEPQVVLCYPLLVGTDGTEKMSKSLGNYVGITESPGSMFGKLMSIADEMMLEYWRLLLDAGPQEVAALKADLDSGARHPREVKDELARRIVAQYHSEAEARAASEEFRRVYGAGELPADLPTCVIPRCELAGGKIWMPKLLKLCDLVQGTSEGKRLVQQGGVSVDGEKWTDPEGQVEVRAGMVLRVGRRRFARVEVSD